MVGSELGPLDPLGPEPELPDPELPDPELPDPELPDPELPDPELPHPELPEWPWPEPGPLESVSSSPLRRLSSPSPGPLRSSPPPPLGSRCGSLGGFGTTATPLTTALVTRAPAHTFATAAPAAPAPPSSATRVATGSVPTPHGIRPKRAGGVIDVRPARTAWRARLSNWRTAPPVAPSSAAISS